ncbi:MAG: integrase core domain-containing protein, partial [Steroidobacteraceae bacterium]
MSVLSILVGVAADLVGWMGLAIRSRKSLEAEILFLRRQLALYMELGMRPRRIDAVTRVSLALLSRFFEWQSSLVVVRPQTLIRWHRAGFRLFWR